MTDTRSAPTRSAPPRSAPARVAPALLAATAFLAAGVLLLLATAWFAVANPSVEVGVDDPGPGGGTNPVECSVAPYDVVLNDEVPSPGGEHARGWAEEVTEHCTDAAHESFTRSQQSAGGAVLLLAVGGCLLVRGRLVRRRPAAAEPEHAA